MMNTEITHQPKHRWLLCLSLSLLLTIVNTAYAVDQPTGAVAKNPSSKAIVAAKPAKAEPQIKTYTINGHADTASAVANNPPASATAGNPLLARRFGPGQFGPGRPWNPAMASGIGPGRR